VVDTAVGARRRIGRRLIGSVAGLLAVGFLAAMVLSGQMRESKQFVKFVPGGVMPAPPAEIDRVELRAGTGRWVFVRADGHWQTSERRLLPVALATHLDDSIKFMHVSAPIRVMERDEWAPIGLREFGLDPPRYTAVLFRGRAAVLEAHFGAPNPQQVLQYMKLERGNEVYLMSRFIGQEWEQALREVAGR
jgi:hypothetical protein